MKKFYSLMLVIISLFSCVIFSACGDKYKNLNISFYSAKGEQIEAVEFLLDYNADPTTIGVQFDGVKQKDLGEVEVYSEPFELTEVSNYRYNGNTVFVDIRANMSSTNAKLIALHKASGKKQSIPLIIDQKSTGLSVDQNLTYIVSIPDTDVVSHFVNMRELVTLTPGATDRLFFKAVDTEPNLAPVGVDFIKLKDEEQYNELGEEYDDVYTGFNVSYNVQHNSTIKVYPVTYLKDYEDNNVDEFRLDKSKQITIKFVKTLNRENVVLTHGEGKNEYEIMPSKDDSLKLVTNDTVLKSINVVPKIKKVVGTEVSYEELTDYGYLDYYDIQATSENGEIASVHVDKALNNVIITSHLANQIQTIDIVLAPKNAVGSIRPIILQVKVEGVLKADTIQVLKDLQEIETTTSVDILDYYNSNVPGTLFNFKSITQAGVPVHEKLDDLQIVIEKDMLSLVNGGDGNKYTHGLEFYLLGKPMVFEEIEYINGEENVTYVAATLNRFSNVYIKYVKTNGDDGSPLKIDVLTINEFSSIDANTKHLDENATTTKEIVFNLVAGVKSASIQAGVFTPSAEDLEYVHFAGESQINPKYIYLSKQEITSGAEKAYYIHVVNNSLTDRMNAKITGKLNFRAELVPISTGITSPLKIVKGFSSQTSEENIFVAYKDAANTIKFEHDNDADNDIVGFVIDENTQVGEYEIYIYQENNKIAQTKIFVYNTLTELKAEDIELSQDGKAFVEHEALFSNRNGDGYIYAEYECDYIAAIGQILEFCINLPQNIKNSNFALSDNPKQNIVAGYKFSIDKKDYAEEKYNDNEKFKLEFVGGSIVDGNIDYVTLEIGVELNTFSDILTPGTTETKTFTISFFVFEKVEQTDAKLSAEELVKQPNDMVGFYFAENSRGSVSIIMDESKWSYVSKPVWKVENSTSGAIIGATDAEDEYTYSFNCLPSSNNYYSIIKVSFTQFAKPFEYPCLVHVNNPVLTERIIVNSEVNLTDDEHETAYINIKDGGTYKVLASQTTNSGAAVTNNGLAIVIVDENGSQQYTSNYFTISELYSTISVKNVDNSHKFKLYILPKDLLLNEIKKETNIINPIELFIDDDDAYSNAYFSADIVLSNGTKENPYLIRTAQQLFEIDDSSILLASHYQLQTSFGLGAFKNQMPIADFSGSITTFGNNIYDIDGITLDDINKNLFKNFTGEMFGIRFGVKYNYDTVINAADVAIYLGLFDKISENAKLTNVFVNLRDSQAIFNYQLLTPNESIQVYFGALAGENAGAIAYVSEIKDGDRTLKTYQNLIGVSGQITLKDGAKGSACVAFGGLVGKNIGTISGSLQSSDVAANDVVFATTSGAIHSVSNIFITSELKNKNSTVGGVIGLNTVFNEDVNGTIQNAYVQSNITADSTSNVGGVIGTNESIKVGLFNNNSEVAIPTEANKLYNIKSVSIVKGNNNVGGITGKDDGGYYLDCDYQILDNLINSTSVRGLNAVGGMVGLSDAGKFLYCSVMSYVWDYKNLTTQEYVVADIVGDSSVGGLIGQVSSINDNHDGSGDSVAERLVVAHSSVNAYVRAKNNVGGIMTAIQGTSVIHNSYFIGKLEGNYGSAMLTDNDNFVKYMRSYAVKVLDTKELQVEAKNYDGSTFDINIPMTNHWWQNAELNGGYIYVTKDNTTTSKYPSDSHKPIFDIAPTSIEVTSKDEHKDLRLQYYDFTIDSKINEETLVKLSKKYNQKGIKDLLTFNVLPAGIGTVVLKATSSNSRVVDISIDGNLIINGIGTCTLTFVSVLDNDIKASIDVVVEYPIGDFYIGTSSLNFDKIIQLEQIEQIGKGMSKQYYMLTKGTILDTLANNTSVSYTYRAMLNANLEITIEYSDNAKLGMVDIGKYVQSTGTKVPDENGKDVYKISATEPFVISVLEQLEDNKNEWFTVTIKPYYVDDNQIKYYQEDDEKGNLVDISRNFNVKTMAGVTGVAASYNKSIVYLNDTVSINLVFNSDVEFVNELINSLNSWNIVNSILANHAGVTLMLDGANWDELKGKLFVKVAQYDNKAHTLTLEFDFDKSIDFTLDAEKQFNFIIEIANVNKVAKVEYTLLSQRINRMDIKNYYYEKETVEDKATGEDVTVKYKVLYDILKATEDNAGLIILDMVPDNAYYDYLEISDITGDEEIVFIQLTKENGNAVNTTPDASKDGKGIKLYRYDGMEEGRFFIKTQISNDYSSKEHIVEVRAYMANGTMLASQRKIIDVKMLPSAKIEYIKPNGQYHTNIADSENGTHPTIQLANGANATIRITTKHTTQEFSPILSGALADKFELTHIAGDLYELRRNSDMPDTVGQIFSLTIEAFAYYDIGSYEMATCTMTFRITNFVIHSVSVNQSIDNNTTREIYGYYNKPLKLEFYFGPTDISYYDSNSSQPLHSTLYRYNELLKNDTTTTLGQINRILYELNNVQNADDNPYLTLKSLRNNNYQDYEWTMQGENPLVLNGNTLIVKEGYNKEYNNIINKYLSIDFYLEDVIENGDQWEIKSTANGAPTKPDGTPPNYYQNSKIYLLNFREVTQWNNPTVVATAEDFINMTSGGNYILKNNIELNNYQPLDVALEEFDGNGYTITINSFGKFNDVDIYAGLFQKVYSSMTVKNVIVKYQTQKDDAGNFTLGYVGEGSNSIDYYDLCNNPDIVYVSARFGGIAALNHGVITNCKVTGRVALRASMVEQNTETENTYTSDFYIGGMVADNTLDEFNEFGYITHSNSELQIFALANIGGFAYRNDGKISTSTVENQATIYAYNMNLSNTLVVEIAGFVVKNTNEISMSFVDLKAGSNATLSPKYGTISAKDTSAGFVYTNSGTINDAYAVLSAAGLNNNKFYGFVATNSGMIHRAYTYINGGKIPSKNDVMFADANTQNIFNSIQFITNATASHEIEGVKTLNPLNYISNVGEYEKAGFAFGDNGAVWIARSNTYPTLKSTTEKVGNANGLLSISELPDLDENDGIDKTEYKVDFTSYGSPSNPYIITDLQDWNLFFNPELQLAMTGYYRIVRDIKFEELGYYPLTSKVTFSGNIEGNNMELRDIMLYSTESLEAIGLFRKLEGNNDATIKNEARNMKLKVSSVWASNTNAVGVLAGIIENFDIYNITIEGDYNVVIVGKNAVGGLAGVVKGNSHINQIESNVSVNATRATTQNNYSVYMSKNNGLSTTNLHNVYYAGSIAGILDLYSNSTFDINKERKMNGDTYFNVQNMFVNSSTFVGVGDTVGALFGFIGEQVRLTNAKADIGGSIMGAQYSAGLVGENRGIIQNSTVVLEDDVFKNASNVVAGVVGLNLGGLIQDVSAAYNAIIHVYDFTIGGIVGRNLFGTVASSHFDGNILAYYTGGIIGANYNDITMLTMPSGTGAFAAENKANVNNQNISNVIPNGYVKYFDMAEQEIQNLSNVSISESTFNNMLENASKCYIYKNLEVEESDEDLANFIVRNRVLGVVVGITFVQRDADGNEIQPPLIEQVTSINPKTDVEEIRWAMEKVGNSYKFNTGNSTLGYELERDFVLIDNPEPSVDAVYKFKNFNIVYDTNYEIPQIMYLIGAKATSMNSWKEYSECYILVGLPLTKE